MTFILSVGNISFIGRVTAHQLKITGLVSILDSFSKRGIEEFLKREKIIRNLSPST